MPLGWFCLLHPMKPDTVYPVTKAEGTTPQESGHVSWSLTAEPKLRSRPLELGDGAVLNTFKVKEMFSVSLVSLLNLGIFMQFT